MYTVSVTFEIPVKSGCLAVPEHIITWNISILELLFIGKNSMSWSHFLKFAFYRIQINIVSDLLKFACTD
jgi:hypothetical protein